MRPCCSGPSRAANGGGGAPGRRTGASNSSASYLLPRAPYEEALTLAQQSIAIVDKPATRALRVRTIRSTRGQCVTVPATRNGESQADTLMYVFNFDDDNGFAVIAANQAVDPVLAVAENGNYTYGEKRAWRISTFTWMPWSWDWERGSNRRFSIH